MKVITYSITLLEPTLVTSLEGDPNESVSFDYIPGSVLRGAIIGKYLRDQERTELDISDPAMRRLFFDGTTRYLNGYPLDHLGRRTLPTPKSWHHEKGNEDDIYDFAVESPDDDRKQWQSVNKPFCLLSEKDSEDGKQKVRLVQPDRYIAVHTTRTRRFGRAIPAAVIDPREGDMPGAVYRYNALAAGQTFGAMILCDDNDADQLQSWLTGEVTLGGSRSGGYGRAELYDARVKTADNWRETGDISIPEVDGRLIITFLSNTLLRDRNGQFVVDPSVVTEKLSDYLGVSLRLQQAFLRGEIIGGFSRKWGLPLPQTLSIQMGSVFVFDELDCDEGKLRELELWGIGERRAEGFGRVAVNWHTEAELELDRTSRTPLTLTVTISPGSESEELLKRMVERMLRRRLDERLVARTNEIQISNPPSNAQLSRLRNILHDELIKEPPNPQRVLEFLNSIGQRNTARRQFERARVGTMTLLNWLEKSLQATDENVWKELFHFRATDMPGVGGVNAELTDSLRTEYLMRLIDAVLVRAIKERRKEGY